MTGLRQRLAQISTTAPTLAWVAFAITLSFMALATLMIVGYTLTDPGGWRGLGLTAAWVVPTAALTVLGFYRPSAGLWALAVATTVPVGFGVWALLDYEAARGWEDRNGPVSLVLLLVVALPLVVTGLSRPGPAGALLTTATALPWLLAMVGAGSEWGVAFSIGLVSAPFLTAGVLDLLAARPRPPSGATHAALPRPVARA